MADTSSFRNGLIMRIEGQLFAIVEFQHVKPGKGGAFVRTKLRRIPDGAVLDRTFRAGEKIEEVRVERHTFQYLYRSDDLHYMMNTETYEQIPLSAGLIEDILPFLKEKEKKREIRHVRVLPGDRPSAGPNAKHLPTAAYLHKPFSPDPPLPTTILPSSPGPCNRHVSAKRTI